MAERPNYTGSGRTVMTAPIRAAAPTAERDASRGTGEGLESFGRGMASGAQSGWQAANYQTQKKLQLAEQLKSNQTKDLMYSVSSFVRKELPEMIQKDPQLGDLSMKTPEELQQLMPKVQALYSDRINELRQKYPQADFSSEHEQEIFDTDFIAPIQEQVWNQDAKIKTEERVTNITEAGTSRLASIPVPQQARDFDGIIFNLRTEEAAVNQEDPRYISPVAKKQIVSQLRRQATEIYRAAAMTAHPGSLSLINSKIDEGFKAGVYDALTQTQLKALATTASSVGRSERMAGMQQVADVAQQALKDGSVQDTLGAASQLVAARQEVATAGGTKPLAEEATNAYVREAGFAVLSGAANRLAQNPVPSLLSGTSLLPPAAARDIIAAHNQLDVVFPENDPKTRRENFFRYVNETHALDSLASLGVEKAFSEVTDKEIDQWVSEVREISKKRVSLVESGKANALTENLPEMKSLVASGANGQQIMEKMNQLQTQAGIPEYLQRWVPSYASTGLQTAFRNGDKAGVQQNLAMLGREFGYRAQQSIEQMFTATEGGKPAFPAGAGMAMLTALAPFSYVGKGKVGSNPTIPLSLNWGAMEAWYNYENNKKNIDAYREPVNLARTIMQTKGTGSLTMGMYLEAFANNIHAPKTMRAGGAEFMEALLLENVMGRGASSSPQQAVNRVFSVLANSFVPIRGGTLDSPGYQLGSIARYRDEWAIQPTDGRGFTTLTKALEVVGAAVSDIPFYSTPDPEAMTASTIFNIRRRFPYDMHLFNANPTVYGEASDLITQRPLFRYGTPYGWLGYNELQPQSNSAFQSYGSQNINFSDLHVEVGGEQVNLAKAYDPKEFPWRPEELGQRAFAEMQGKEGAAPATRVRVAVGQNRQWIYNPELNGWQLHIRARAVGNRLLGRVPQEGEWLPVRYGNGNPVVQLDADVNRSIETFLTSTMVGLRW